MPAGPHLLLHEPVWNMAVNKAEIAKTVCAVVAPHRYLPDCRSFHLNRCRRSGMATVMDVQILDAQRATQRPYFTAIRWGALFAGVVGGSASYLLLALLGV